MNYIILFLGFLFGAILQYAHLNKYNVISGLALLENLAVIKTIALSIGIGIMFLSIEISLGLASYHIKPFVTGGLIVGGLLFGTGMAILGYCPGTLAISLGEGSLDALIGIIGGFLGGVVYTIGILPLISPLLVIPSVFSSDNGAVSLNSLLGTNAVFFIISFIVGLAFILSTFYLHKKDKNKKRQWIASGIALALLNLIVFSVYVTNRPIGASTAFPYFADLLTGFTNNTYFDTIKNPGHWELIFLAGAFVAGLVISLIRNDFRLTLIHDNWKKHKGNSKGKRIIWSFVGGFILIIGARMAGGCTSGHILSGGMQFAFSSMFFSIFVFAGLLITGKYFYKK